MSSDVVMALSRSKLEVTHTKQAIVLRKEVIIPIAEDVYEAIGRIYGELEGELFVGVYLNESTPGLSEAEERKTASTVEVHAADPMVEVMESITRAMRRLGGLHGNIWPGFTDRSHSRQGYDWCPRIYTNSKLPETAAGNVRTYRFTGYTTFDSLKKYKHGVNILVELADQAPSSRSSDSIPSTEDVMEDDDSNSDSD